MKLLTKKITYIILILCSYCSYGEAKIQLPSILGNGMVLQQKSEVRLWGKATPNKKVAIYTSWNAQQREVNSNKKGDWMVTVTTPEAGGPYTIRISDGEELLLDDVLIGEVWLCSGQSNMEMPVKGFRGQPVAESQNTIVNANLNRSLRLFTVQRAYSSTPEKDVAGQWKKNTPKSVATFSAVAYYYGDQLQKVLGIPVGLIHASWSGSSIEPWISKENLLQFPEVDLTSAENPQLKYANSTPTVLYNAMIKPLENYSIKGMIWYQGESNSAQPEQYQKLFAIWVKQNRELFRSPTMPIYYTEIAPVASPVNKPLQRAIFREAQLESMYEIPNVGMAFTTDLGDEALVHAAAKKEIGQRLAYWALAKTYQLEGFEYSGPIYRSCTIRGNAVEITFDHAEGGLIPENQRITGFEVAGPDSVFYPANASIINGTSRIKVWHDQIAKPIEVRYCFRNFLRGNLCNNAWLPAISFRIDLRKNQFKDPALLGWIPINNVEELPDYIRVYRSPTWVESTRTNAYVAIVDMNKAQLDIANNQIYNSTNLYYKPKKEAIILLSGGHNDSILIYRKGKILANNPDTVCRMRDGKTAIYYPTRSVFSLLTDNSFRTDWIYKVGDKIYSYMQPAFNNIAYPPLIRPSKNFPREAIEWKAQMAIGGGPVLIKDGTIRNSWVEELYDEKDNVAAHECRSRSAIGITHDKKLILFICEKDDKKLNVPGMTLDQLARVMKAFGCVEALNLQGEKYACMLVNGKSILSGRTDTLLQQNIKSVLLIK